jgi:hypothetical protein
VQSNATAGGGVQHLERGTVVLEDPDVASWHFNSPAPVLKKLITLIVEAFRRTGGDWDAGRHHLDLFDSFGIEANVRAEVFALPPGHPYLRLPLQFATALEARLLSLVGAASWSGCATIDTIELYERNMIDELALRLVHGELPVGSDKREGPRSGSRSVAGAARTATREEIRLAQWTGTATSSTASASGTTIGFGRR